MVAGLKVVAVGSDSGWGVTEPKPRGVKGGAVAAEESEGARDLATADRVEGVKAGESTLRARLLLVVSLRSVCDSESRFLIQNRVYAGKWF